MTNSRVVQHTIDDPNAFCAWWQMRSTTSRLLEKQIVQAATSAGLIVGGGGLIFLTSLGRRFAKINAAQRYLTGALGVQQRVAL